MPKICPRCRRHHSGACGIPSIGVMIGAGTVRVRAEGGRATVPDSYPISASPGKRKQRALPNRGGLEELLVWGMEQEQKIVEMLKVLPPDIPTYQQLLERLDRVIEVNRQVRAQIALRDN